LAFAGERWGLVGGLFEGDTKPASASDILLNFRDSYYSLGGRIHIEGEVMNRSQAFDGRSGKKGWKGLPGRVTIQDVKDLGHANNLHRVFFGIYVGEANMDLALVTFTLMMG
jgi:hypothetical protein